jgi:hypothetical protein
MWIGLVVVILVALVVLWGVKDFERDVGLSPTESSTPTPIPTPSLPPSPTPTPEECTKCIAGANPVAQCGGLTVKSKDIILGAEFLFQTEPAIVDFSSNPKGNVEVVVDFPEAEAKGFIEGRISFEGYQMFQTDNLCPISEECGIELREYDIFDDFDINLNWRNDIKGFLESYSEDLDPIPVFAGPNVKVYMLHKSSFKRDIINLDDNYQLLSLDILGNDRPLCNSMSPTGEIKLEKEDKKVEIPGLLGIYVISWDDADQEWREYSKAVEEVSWNTFLLDIELLKFFEVPTHVLRKLPNVAITRASEWNRGGVIEDRTISYALSVEVPGEYVVGGISTGTQTIEDALLGLKDLGIEGAQAAKNAYDWAWENCKIDCRPLLESVQSLFE